MDDDLTLYAMGALDSGEMERVAAHVSRCVSCRSELQRIHADLGSLAMGAVPDATPPARVRDRLMQEIAADLRATAPAPEPKTSGLRWLFAIPVLTTVILAVGMVFLSHQNVILRQQRLALLEQAQSQQADAEQAKRVLETLSAEDAMRVTLVSAKTKPQPQAQTIYSRSTGRLVLVASNLEPVAPNKAYELWLLPASGSAPVPAGMFKPDAKGNAQLLLPQLPSGMEAKGFAVTVEPEHGSAAPTSAIMMVGMGQ